VKIVSYDVKYYKNCSAYESVTALFSDKPKIDASAAPAYACGTIDLSPLAQEWLSLSAKQFKAGAHNACCE
jgi:hypothetical protein